VRGGGRPYFTFYQNVSKIQTFFLENCPYIA
jgi:hypothetical protein